MVDLLEHNKIAYEKIVEALENGNGTKKLAISHATEAGKASYNLHIADNSEKGMRVIYKRLRKRIKNPTYKGYRFEYID